MIFIFFDTSVFLVIIGLGYADTNGTVEITLGEAMIDWFINGTVLMLLGYTCLSYVKGMSYKAQRFLVYFTYIYTIYFIFSEFIFEAYEKDGSRGSVVFGLLSICILIVSILLYINKSKTKIS